MLIFRLTPSSPSSFRVFSFGSSQSYPALSQLRLELCTTGARSGAARRHQLPQHASVHRHASCHASYSYFFLSACPSPRLFIYLNLQLPVCASLYYTCASESVFLIWRPSIGHIGGPEVLVNGSNCLCLSRFVWIMSTSWQAKYTILQEVYPHPLMYVRLSAVFKLWACVRHTGKVFFPAWYAKTIPCKALTLTSLNIFRINWKSAASQVLSQH